MNSHDHQHSLGSSYPLINYITCDKFSMSYRAFLAAITTCIEPCSFDEAMTDDRWKDVIQREIQALEENHT